MNFGLRSRRLKFTKSVGMSIGEGITPLLDLIKIEIEQIAS